MRRILLLVAGTLALALGGVGLLVPVLPTTPFVLCAAGCYATASPRMYQKLLHMRFFGEYIQNYRNKVGISQKARFGGLAFLWLALVVSMLLSRNPYLVGGLAFVGAVVSVHILTIRKRT